VLADPAIRLWLHRILYAKDAVEFIPCGNVEITGSRFLALAWKRLSFLAANMLLAWSRAGGALEARNV
jgi:hypothetical protein